MSIKQWTDRDFHASSKVLNSKFSSKFFSSSAFSKFYQTILLPDPRPWFLFFISTMAYLFLIEWQPCRPLQVTALSVLGSVCQEYHQCNQHIHCWGNTIPGRGPGPVAQLMCCGAINICSSWDTDSTIPSQNSSSHPLIPGSLSKWIFPYRIEVFCQVIQTRDCLLSVSHSWSIFSSFTKQVLWLSY